MAHGNVHIVYFNIKIKTFSSKDTTTINELFLINMDVTVYALLKNRCCVLTQDNTILHKKVSLFKGNIQFSYLLHVSVYVSARALIGSPGATSDLKNTKTKKKKLYNR